MVVRNRADYVGYVAAFLKEKFMMDVRMREVGQLVCRLGGHALREQNKAVIASHKKG